MEEKVIKDLPLQSGLAVRTGLKAGVGLGDRIADFTHATGLEKLADLYTQVTGKDCGCEQRRAWLNELFPNL